MTLFIHIAAVIREKGFCFKHNHVLESGPKWSNTELRLCAGLFQGDSHADKVKRKTVYFHTECERAQPNCRRWPHSDLRHHRVQPHRINSPLHNWTWEKSVKGKTVRRFIPFQWLLSALIGRPVIRGESENHQQHINGLNNRLSHCNLPEGVTENPEI